MADMPDYHMYVVPVTVSIPAGESPIGDVAKYQATPAALSDGDRGPLLIDQHGRLYVIIYGTPEIDHAKIKGVALKTPTTAESIPVSIESPAIAYDVGNDVFKVHAIVSGAAIDPRQIRALTSTDVVTVVQATAANLKVTTTPSERGAITHFSETSTADVITPAGGKKVRVLGAFFYSTDDIIVELRYKTSGDVVLALPTIGAVGMELKTLTPPEGDANEVVEIYLSGTGTVKGWTNHEET